MNEDEDSKSLFPSSIAFGLDLFPKASFDVKT